MADDDGDDESGLADPSVAFQPLDLPTMSDEQVIHAFRTLSNLRLLAPSAHLEEIEAELSRRGLRTLN
jgi:hypothetical protein